MAEPLSTDPWEGVLAGAEQQTGLQPGLLRAIAQQENVAPRHYNPLGLSTGAGVRSFDPQSAIAAIQRQAALLTSKTGPYAEFARTGDINALAKVYSPPGARNDPYGTNVTEAGGIKANLEKRFLSADPSAGMPKAAPETPQATLPTPDHSAAWNQSQAAMAAQATAAGLPDAANGRDRLINAIDRSAAAGYPIQHFAGQPNEPLGDRPPTMDIENLVKALRAREVKDPSVAKERAYWEKELAQGMTAEQWQRQTGEPSPQYPVPTGIGGISPSLAQEVGPPAPVAPPQDDLRTMEAGLGADPGALEDFRKAHPQLYSAIANAAGGAYDVGKEFVQGLATPSGLAGLVSPLPGAYEELKQSFDTLRGQPPPSPIAQAETTPPYSRERFKAGLGEIANVLMAGAIGKQITAPHPAAVAERPETVATPTVETPTTPLEPPPVEGYARVAPPEAAPPTVEAAKPAITLTERTLPEGDITGTHAVDITNPEGKNIGYVGGNVTDQGFEVNISTIDKAERGKGTYQDVIGQLADKYGTVKSDADLTPSAEAAWQKVGAEKQEDGSYVLRKAGETPSASEITSPEGVPSPQVRPSVDEGAPLREQGQVASTREGEPVQEPTPQEAVNEPEPHVSAIANRYVKERATAGEVGEIAPGQGYSTRELAQAGLEMPPEVVTQHVSDLMQGKGNPIEQGKAVRAEEARLSQRSNQASRVAEANPTPENKIAADNAFKDLTDFHNGPVAKLKTVFHATGMGLQGELPVDLSTYNGLREKWLKDTGKAPPPNVEPTLRRTAKNVADAAKAENGARSRLSQEIDKATKGRKMRSADEVRDSIRERMGLGPCRT